VTGSSERYISKPVFNFLFWGLLVGILLYFLSGILTPVILAFLLAYAFNPLVERLARYHIPRGLSTVLCLLILLVLAVGLIALIVPALQHEITLVLKKMPRYLDEIRQRGIPWIQDNLQIEVPESLDEALSSIKQELGGQMGSLAGPVGAILSTMLSGTLGLLSTLLYIIIIPLFTFYFLRDFQRITDWVKDLIPSSRREYILHITHEIDVVLAGFIRGQLTVCAILAVIYSTLLSVIGVPVALIIGIVTGLFNMVPYLGLVTGLSLSWLFLLLEGYPWTSFLMVLIVFTVIPVLDSLFLTPNVLGKKLGLAPVVVILALLAFGGLFGFLGVLIAVPVTAIGKVLLIHALEAYRCSRFFT
jgi:predicted PurR-regulated permease PerM